MMFKINFSIAIALALGGTQVYAQDDNDSDSESSELNVVVVTATKRSVPMQSVPIAISAIDNEIIADIGATDLSDLSAVSTSALITPGGFVAIRGVGDASRNIGGDTRATIYIDGVLAGRSYASNQNLLDVESVEILRGPQGTLFGKNSVSGAININTRKPHEDFEGQFAVEVGNYDHKLIEGYVNVPLMEDKLFLSVQASYLGEDGYINNILLDKKMNGRDRYTMRAKMLYQASENTEIIFAADYLEESTPAVSGIAQPQPGGDLWGGNAASPGRFDVAHNAEEFQNNEFKGGSITLNHDFANDYALRSITAYRDNSFKNQFDDDFSPLDVDVLDFNESSTQFSQELNITSPTDGNFDYVAGIYYIDQNLNSEQKLFADSSFLFNVLFGLPIVGPWDITLPGKLEDKSISAFVHGNYRFDDQWTLSAGIRYTHQKKSIDYSITDSWDAGSLFFLEFDNFMDSKTFDEWSPTVSLNYSFNDDVMAYSSYSRGFKSGGWNADYIQTLEQIGFDSEFVDSYEIGLKSTLLDNRLRLNFAGFLTKFTDYQVFQFVRTSPDRGIFVFTNAGEVSTRGIEIEAVAMPTEGLKLTANYTYTDAVYDKFRDAGGPGVDYDGNDLGATAPHNFYGAVDYNMAFENSMSMRFHVDYTYSSSHPTTADNEEIFDMDSVSLVNARIVLFQDNSGLSYSLWVKNLLDTERDFVSGSNFLGTSVGMPPQQRTYGLKVRYQF